MRKPPSWLKVSIQVLTNLITLATGLLGFYLGYLVWVK